VEQAFSHKTRVYVCLQVAEEEGLITSASEMDDEPYFVDFLRDAPEMTGTYSLSTIFL
jgi:hypothetical protein